MIRLGVTGGAGMGKTTTGSLLQRRGMPVVDTDVLARQIVEPGQPALSELVQIFGRQVIGPDGRLRRDQLARIVFADPAALRRLEQMLHPRIRRLWLDQFEAWRAEGRALAAVIIPLLFETEAEKDLDAVLCIACSAATQRERLEARGWSPEEIEQRLRAQWPIEKKIARARYLVWTEANEEIHALQLDRILRGLGQA